MANEATTNVIAFHADLQAFAERMNIDILLVLKRVVFSIATKAAERMPKDTGRATANINTSVGSPDHTILPEGDYPDSTSIAQQKARAALEGLQKPEVMWISFPLPYHAKLNAGSSRKAPAAFLEMAVAEVEAEIDSYKGAA